VVLDLSIQCSVEAVVMSRIVAEVVLDLSIQCSVEAVVLEESK
jgi:hypothetical protein